MKANATTMLLARCLLVKRRERKKRKKRNPLTPHSPRTHTHTLSLQIKPTIPPPPSITTTFLPTRQKPTFHSPHNHHTSTATQSHSQSNWYNSPESLADHVRDRGCRLQQWGHPWICIGNIACAAECGRWSCRSCMAWGLGLGRSSGGRRA